MQYVIKTESHSYYAGPNKDYVWKIGYWNYYLKNATVFSDLTSAKDILSDLNKTYPGCKFVILEYHPATTGKAILSEKEQLLQDLSGFIDLAENGIVSWNDVLHGLVPTLKSAIKFIKENVND